MARMQAACHAHVTRITSGAALPANVNVNSIACLGPPGLPPTGPGPGRIPCARDSFTQSASYTVRVNLCCRLMEWRLPVDPVLDVPLTEQAKYLAIWLAYDALSIAEILWGLHG